MSHDLDEVRDDVWHLLLHLFSYQERSSRLVSAGYSRLDLVDEIVALNALAENIVLRVARLADTRRDVRSIKNYCKRHPLSGDLETHAKEFHQAAQAVVRVRHARIAHMKSGDLSAYPLAPLPPRALMAIEALVRFVDSASETTVNYVLRAGRLEPLIDLRASLSSGALVEV